MPCTASRVGRCARRSSARVSWRPSDVRGVEERTAKTVGEPVDLSVRARTDVLVTGKRYSRLEMCARRRKVTPRRRRQRSRRERIPISGRRECRDSIVSHKRTVSSSDISIPPAGWARSCSDSSWC